MKTLLYCLGCCIFLLSCNSNDHNHADDDGHSCTKKCAASCSAREGADDKGKFDFALSSVCQVSCGVSNYEESDIVNIAEAKVGDITMCPVSGAIYKVKHSSPILEHKGKTFHSCCMGCADTFKDDPDRFYKNVKEVS